MRASELLADSFITGKIPAFLTNHWAFVNKVRPEGMRKAVDKYYQAESTKGKLFWGMFWTFIPAAILTILGLLGIGLNLWAQEETGRTDWPPVWWLFGLSLTFFIVCFLLWRKERKIELKFPQQWGHYAQDLEAFFKLLLRDDNAPWWSWIVEYRGIEKNEEGLKKNVVEALNRLAAQIVHKQKTGEPSGALKDCFDGLLKRAQKFGLTTATARTFFEEAEKESWYYQI